MFIEKIVNIKSAALTLAEVIIVMGILGLLAEITLPVLISNVQDQAAVAAIRKSYSTFAQAYSLATQDNGTIDQWGLVGGGTGSDGKLVLDTLAPYLNLTKNCGRNPGCFPSVIYKRLDGGYDTDGMTIFDNDINAARAKLADGSIIGINAYKSDPEYGGITLDINGYKGPNQLGIDTFKFIIYKTKIVPAGAPKDGHYIFPNQCDKSATGGITRNGNACTAWVLYQNNMDYLHCSGLSWNGSVRCP